VNAWRKETTACQEATEANPEKMEVSVEDIQSGAEHREVPKEHAALKSVGGLRKRQRSRNLAAERPDQPKERNRCGFRGKLAAARRKMARSAGVARRKTRRQEESD
jgi:hypothetical protein